VPRTITAPNDPDSGNNVYSENFSQPAVVTATVPVITYALAGTDRNRDNTPKGKVWVRITSNDQGHPQDIGVQLACSAVAKEHVGGAKTTIADAPLTILVPPNPGQTAA
jgi:hypothetical protein